MATQIQFLVQTFLCLVVDDSIERELCGYFKLNKEQTTVAASGGFKLTEERATVAGSAATASATACNVKVHLQISTAGWQNCGDRNTKYV